MSKNCLSDKRQLKIMNKPRQEARTETNTSGTSGVRYLPLGECVIVIYFKNEISIEVNKRVHRYIERVKAKNIPGVRLVIPTYNTVAIRYDPLAIRYGDIIRELKCLEGHAEEFEENEGLTREMACTRTVHIPAVYGGEYGPDINEVAERTGLAIDEVIRIHSSQKYIVYMLGFTAGFPYCGDVDKRLVLSRLSSPRLKVPPGNIAIVDRLTIIHSIETPTGWHSIARTPLGIFDPHLDPPGFVNAGDYIKFEPISPHEASAWNNIKQREWDEQWNLLK